VRLTTTSALKTLPAAALGAPAITSALPSRLRSATAS
jgi:hypothetical protein